MEQNATYWKYFNYFRTMLFTYLETNGFTNEEKIFTKVEHSSELATESYLNLLAKNTPPAEAHASALEVLFYGYPTTMK